MDVKIAKVAALTVLDQIGLLDESDDGDDYETTFVVAIGTLLTLYVYWQDFFGSESREKLTDEHV